jgi:phosphatidate cytidylyltransferase
MQREDSFMSGAPFGKHLSHKIGNFGDLGVRLMSAAVLITLALVAMIAGGAIFALFWLVAAFAVNWEWQKLLGEIRRQERIFVGGVGVAAAAGIAQTLSPAWGFAALFLLAGAVSLLAAQGLRLWAFGGVAYAGALVVFVNMLRASPQIGVVSIAWLFAVVWGSDAFAYFGGRLIGGPKLWPRVSAGKTWSGTITGLLAGATLGLVVAKIGTQGASAGLPVFLVSLVASVCSQIGDLVESSIKRRFGVKDSSALIPGHGGVMDRIDGFIFAAAFAAALGAVRGLPSVAAGVFFW